MIYLYRMMTAITQIKIFQRNKLKFEQVHIFKLTLFLRKS